jgi:hypothetical protein
MRNALFLDRGPPDATTLVSGMGRSGTTWVAQLIDHDRSHRVLFEPFFPAKVPEARPFAYIQYMHPHDDDPERAAAAHTILTGRLRHPDIDGVTRGWVFRRRLIKDIRCNLMLGWLARLRPAIPIVLVVRHPLAVTASWLRLGWGREAQGTRTDYDIITSQTRLLDDFPELRQLARHVDPASPLDRIVFQWCAFHLVPARQLTDARRLVVHYENLLVEREHEFERMAAFLGNTVDRLALAAAFARPSATSYTAGVDTAQRGRPAAGTGSDPDDHPASPAASADAVLPSHTDARLLAWQRVLSADQIERAFDLLSLCGLDTVYADDGMPATISVPARERS